MGVSKVIYGSNTLIDLTADSVVANALLNGYTAHGADGNAITGNCTFDADTSDANATASTLLIGSNAYVNGTKIEGQMPNRGAVTGYISAYDEEFTINAGYHDGSGKVSINAVEQEKFVPENIKEGVTLMGVVGNCSPAANINAQARTTDPYTTEQTILPEIGYDYLSQVKVNAIYYDESPAAQGNGTVVTIGKVAPTV